MFTLKKSGELVLVQAKPLQDLPVHHAITTRIGGVSQVPYATLNMAFHTGDDSKAVIENRRRVCHTLGVTLDQMVAGDQVHGSTCYIVEKGDAGRGAEEQETTIPATDILITATPGVVLASFYADCVPVLLVDPVRRVIGIAHCGWRGTQQEAPRIAIETMVQAFGTCASDIRAVIGPSIGPCCYEVEHTMAECFQQQFGPDVALGRQLDLRLANVRTLRRAGVSSDAISVAPWCTSCQNTLFFSHRADGGRTGRIAALLSLIDQHD